MRLLPSRRARHQRGREILELTDWNGRVWRKRWARG